MKKEIEVKAKIGDKHEVMKKLAALGCVFTEPTKQEDSIFTNYKGDFTKIPLGDNVLRIRKAKGKIILTLKQAQKNQLDCLEKEFEVSDGQEARDVLELLGYKVAVEITKIREKTKLGEYEICVDQVEKLGSFIEVEKMSDEDGEIVQEELFGFLESLGIIRENRVELGYDTLMYLKQNE